VFDIKPTFYDSQRLRYINNRRLIFEGGNEFHRFDASSVYAASYGTDRVECNSRACDVFLNPASHPRAYYSEQDVDGKFLINFQEAFENPEIEADYVRVHFAFESEMLLDGAVYVCGDFNQNELNRQTQMHYVVEDRCYRASVLLKQGGYNYQYRFLPRGASAASVKPTDGSFWQTRNEYVIYVYHRPWGERYDKLIGVKIIS